MRKLRSLVLGSLLLVLGGLGAACGDGDSPQPDAAVDPCAKCTADQLCVQSFGGTCQPLGVSCVSPMVGNVDCRKSRCDPACESAYCNQPLSCQSAPACPGESAKAFQCYGP